jgi:hypothetical protein
MEEIPHSVLGKGGIKATRVQEKNVIVKLTRRVLDARADALLIGEVKAIDEHAESLALRRHYAHSTPGWAR